MLAVGAKVRVASPFTPAFPDVYEVEQILDIEGGPAYTLVGVDSAFDERYLEVVDDSVD